MIPKNLADLAPFGTTRKELLATAPEGIPVAGEVSPSKRERLLSDSITSRRSAAEVVTVLKERLSDASFCDHACEALCAIAATHRDTCVAAGAVDLLTACLKNHATSAAVCVQACWALSSIAGSSAGRDACVASGSVPHITACLKNHAASSAVCAKACEALGSIACYSLGQKSCMTSGAVPLIVACLKNHLTSPTVCERACDALHHIGWCNPSNVYTISSSGVIPLAVECHSKHSGYTKVASQQLLRVLGYSETGVKI
jgi:hypothetical protein